MEPLKWFYNIFIASHTFNLYTSVKEYVLVIKKKKNVNADQIKLLHNFCGWTGVNFWSLFYLLVYLLACFSHFHPVPPAVLCSIITSECPWHFTGSVLMDESERENRKIERKREKLLCGTQNQQVTFCCNGSLLDLLLLRGLRRRLIF